MRGVLAVLLVAFAAGWAQAGPFLFTFDDGGLADGDGDIKTEPVHEQPVSPLVLINGAQVHSGDGFGSDQYLWTRPQLLGAGDILIGMVVPTTSVSFDGYIFDATSDADFTFTAYNLHRAGHLSTELEHGQRHRLLLLHRPVLATGVRPEILQPGTARHRDRQPHSERDPGAGAGLLVMAGTAVVGSCAAAGHCESMTGVEDAQLHHRAVRDPRIESRRYHG